MIIPEIYQSLVDFKGHAAVEHSVLDARADQVLLAMALRDIERYYDILFYTPNIERVRYLLAKWGFKGKTLSKDPYIIKFPQAELWIADSIQERQLDKVYCIDSHEMSEIPKQPNMCLAGVFCDRDHWFYTYSREASLLTRISARETLSLFQTQTKSGLQSDHPYYSRRMLLEDTEPKCTTSNFVAFSKKRLFIRSDKDPQFFSSLQRQDASTQHGTPIVHFDVSSLQKRYLAAKRLAVSRGKRPWFILLKYRRGGFTTIEQGLSYQMCVTRPRSHVTTLAHTKQSTQRIFRIVHLYCDKDPENSKEPDSKSEIEFENGSYFFIGTAGGRGFGRGDTLQKVHGSEVSKWLEGPNQIEDVDDLIGGLLGAASNGEVVLESTPNGKEWFYQNYTGAKDNTNEFTPVFLRWFDDPVNRISGNTDEIRETLSDEEKSLIEKHGLTLEQIAFRRREKRIYGRLFLQEMPEDDISCFITSGICFFDTERLLQYLETIPENGTGINRRAGIEHRWEEPIPGFDYVCGVDTSEGLQGSDLSGLGILKRENGEQVCSLHGLFSPRELADHCVRLARDYNDALLGVERENHGHAVLEKVKDHGYENVYSFSRDRLGWSTNAETRPVMLDELAEAIEEGYMKLNDRDLIDECLSFRKQASGKYEADSGAFDDRVMKWAIAWQMRKVRSHEFVVQEL